MEFIKQQRSDPLMKRSSMILRVAALIAATSISAIAFGQQNRAAMSKSNGRDAKIIAAVRAILDAQVTAWNRGDVEAYMDGYARSPDTIFISGDNVTRGWQTVLERYQKNYNSREKMG